MRRWGPAAVLLALCLGVFPVAAAPVEQGTRPTLRRGATGPAVVELQRRLNGWIATSRAVPRLAQDGIFGPRTDAAVRAYQRARGLAVDGIVGPRTWAALVGARAPAPARRTPATTPPARPAPAAPAAASGVVVQVACTGKPELTTIINNTGQTITITSIGSLYRPRQNEPFQRGQQVAAGL